MRRKRRGFSKDFFEIFFEDFDSLFKGLESEMESLGGGYSLSVVSTPEGTRIHVKADGNVDVTKLRKELERQYPGATIVIEGGKPIIEEAEEEKAERISDHVEGERRSLLSDILGGNRRVIIKEDEDEKGK